MCARNRHADRNVGAPTNVGTPSASSNLMSPREQERPPYGRQECRRSRRRPGVRATVARKRATEGPLEPAEAEIEARLGSKGWYTRGYLPHYDKPGTLQMVTFRLADAMPAARRHEWEALLKIEDDREQRTKLEAYLDLGHGECVLKNPRAAGAVEEVLLRFDGERYRLAAWVVMPNHVHVAGGGVDDAAGRVAQGVERRERPRRQPCARKRRHALAAGVLGSPHS